MLSETEKSLFKTIQRSGYELMIQLTELDMLDEEDDNVDIKVYFDDGQVFTATVFTLKNIQTLMERYKESGECMSGLYFYTYDMLIVERITIEIIDRVTQELIESGDYKFALRSLTDD